jgi:hypothetical protein
MNDFKVDFGNADFGFARQNPNRLNWRCELLLTRNQEHIKNKRVLDIASQDGRFSYASLKLGAIHVTGVEGRKQSVEKATENLRKSGFDPADFHFIIGDIFDYLSQFESGQFDTILCLGFFYHTVKQHQLFSELRRLQPESIILDTDVVKVPRILRVLKRLKGTKVYENLIGPGDRLGIDSLLRGNYFVYNLVNSSPEDILTTTDPLNVIAIPTNQVLQMLLKAYGYSFWQIDWKTAEINNWAGLQDYLRGGRASYILKPGNYSAGYYR